MTKPSRDIHADPDYRHSRRAYRALKALQGVGGLHWVTIFWFVTLVILVSLIAMEAYELAKLGFGNLIAWLATYSNGAIPAPRVSTPDMTWWEAMRAIVIVVVFLFVVSRLVYIAQKRITELRPRVLVAEPSSAVAVIMFLSTPNLFKLKECWRDGDGSCTSGGTSSDQTMFRRYLSAACVHVRLVPYTESPAMAADRVITPQVRKKAFKIGEPIKDVLVTKPRLETFFVEFNWRMNVESLRLHAFPGAPLREVALIPSAGNGGSIHWLAEAKGLIHDFLVSRGLDGVTVKGCGEFIDSDNNRLPEAIDYEDVRGLVDALYEITRSIKLSRRCGERDVIVDITSGKALCSAAGLAFATLVEDRRVQYVDTESLEVKTFDVTHEVDLKDE